MAQMRIAGEIINIPDKAPAPKPKRGPCSQERLPTTLQHPIKLLLNPDHVLFELGVLFKNSDGDVIARQAEFQYGRGGCQHASPCGAQPE